MSGSPTSTTAASTAPPTTGRERILNEAAELFLSRGYGETSLRDIAAAVGIQPASIYHHFESKEALFLEIMRIGTSYTSSAFDQAAAELSEDASPEEILSAHIEGHLTALFDHAPFTASSVVLFSVASESVKSKIVPTRDAYELRWENLLQSLAKLDELALDLDVRMARRIVLGSVNSTLEWFNPQLQGTPNGQTVSDLAQVMTKLVWKGIAR